MRSCGWPKRRHLGFGESSFRNPHFHHHLKLVEPFRNFVVGTSGVSNGSRCAKKVRCSDAFLLRLIDHILGATEFPMTRTTRFGPAPHRAMVTVFSSPRAGTLAIILVLAMRPIRRIMEPPVPSTSALS